MEGFLPILIMIGLGVGFAAGNVLLSQFVGPRKPTPEKMAPYECGMPAVGDARERQSVKFYLVAMIFLLFDIEVAFLYPWAIAFRQLGVVGLLADRGVLRAPFDRATSTCGERACSIGAASVRERIGLCLSSKSR